MLVATLSQRRFAYYYAVNIALLCGYISWRILEWSGLRKPSPLGEVETEKVELERRKNKKRKAKKRKEARRPIISYTRYVLPVVAVVIVFFAVFYPNIGEAVNTAKYPSGPDEAWHSSLLWMRDNTPEPFEDPDFYYELYDRPPTGQSGSHTSPTAYPMQIPFKQVLTMLPLSSLHRMNLRRVKS